MRPAVLALALVLGGCGYSTESLMPRGIDRVAVEAFGNETWYRRAEFTFTQEMSRELVRRAGVTLRDSEDAQAVIRGRILEIPRMTLIEDRHGQLLEGGVIVKVEVTMEDAKTGEVIVPTFVVARRAEYIEPRGETLQSAIDEAVRDAARDAVDRIQAGSFLAQRVRP